MQARRFSGDLTVVIRKAGADKLEGEKSCQEQEQWELSSYRSLASNWPTKQPYPHRTSRQDSGPWIVQARLMNHCFHRLRKIEIIPRGNVLMENRCHSSPILSSVMSDRPCVRDLIL